MVKGIRYYLKYYNHRKFFRKAGVNVSDVFVASFPKSGNTWMRFILARALYTQQLDQDNLMLFFPTVHRSSAEEINKLPSPRYIKTHAPFFNLYPRTIYLYRDYRAVVVSAWFHARNKAGFSGTLDEFISSPLLRSFGPWYWHVQLALDWHSRHTDRMLLVRYESLVENPKENITRLLEFTGINPVIPVDEIIQRTTFNVLQQMEKTTRPGDVKPFFRSGALNNWREHLTPALERKLLSKKDREIMSQCGYVE